MSDYSTRKFRKPGIGQGSGVDADFADLFRCLKRIQRLGDGLDNEEIKEVYQIFKNLTKQAKSNFQSTATGAKILSENKNAIRLRKNKDNSYFRISATRRDDWRMPWVMNGTDYRYTDGEGPVIMKSAYRGKMSGKNVLEPIIQQADSITRQVQDKLIQFVDDFGSEKDMSLLDDWNRRFRK